jgi:L-threonylcarbamoyladenylate synthase
MEVLSPDAGGVARAAEMLLQGEVIGFPTDTVYGLAALARNPAAVERIYEIKRRPADRRLVVMVAAPAALRRLVRVDDRARAIMRRWWPGPLTLVLPSLHGEDSLAVRIPSHAVALELLRKVGDPLATTSANLSGRPPALSAADLAGLEGLTAVLDAGRAPGGVPSTLLDLTTPEPRVLRTGPISAQMLFPPPGEVR